VVVPGGGPFADAVRTAQAATGFGESLAHRLALDAMDRMAQVFAAVEPSLSRVDEPGDLGAVVAEGRIPVWSPIDLMAGHPAIAESWAITSDSLAAWLATAIRAKRLLVVKSVDPEPGSTPADWAAAGMVDEAFPAFARRFGGIVEILGPSRWPSLSALESLAV
jgi:aspartokinase-like uncharacterized kinase